MFYSAQTGGFYSPDIHGNSIPAGAVEVSDELYHALFEGQSNGKRIVADASGRPVLADQPQLTLEEIKAAGCSRIDAARDEFLASGFVYNGIRFDSDDKSVRRINGAVTICLLDPNHSEQWITQDNSGVTLNADDIKGLGLAAADHERSTLFKARLLKDEIEAATSRDEVDAVMWV